MPPAASEEGIRHGTSGIQRTGGISGPVLRRLPGPAAQPAEHRVPHLPGDPDLDRAHDRVRLRGLHSAVPHLRDHVHTGTHRRGALLRPAADDLVPAQVSPVVVRLEPRTTAVHQPGHRLPVPDGRPLPLHRRPPIGPPRLPLPRSPEPVAAADQVAAGDPALHRAVLPQHRLIHRGDRGVVRDLDHRPLPQGLVRLRRGRHPLEHPGDRLHAHPGHRPLPAVPAGLMRTTAASTASPSAAPPTTSSGRWAPTYMRLRPTMGMAVTTRARPAGPRRGRAAEPRATATPACPDTYPRPAAWRPRQRVPAIRTAGRERRTIRLTSFESAQVLAP